MKRSKILDRIRKARAKYIDIFIDNSFDFSDRIQFILDKKNLEQKDLARLLKKNESEISKWLSGSHNFTVKTLAKIEDVLGEKLYEVVNEDVISDKKVELVYLIDPQQIYIPEQKKDKSHLKSYSINYKNTILAEC